MTIRLADPAETEALGARLAVLLRAGDVVALSGELGAGKTTFARGLLRALAFEGDVVSPTFPIVVAYEPPETRLPLWHVDLFRIEQPGEIDELALSDARLDSALLIEWPERLGTALWPDALRLRIDTVGEGVRALTAQVPPAWGDRWPPR